MGVWVSSPVDPGTNDCAELLFRYPRAYWEGWGCSLCWFGKALGATPKPEVEAWADLLFSLKDVPLRSICAGDPLNVPERDNCQTIPGLGLNIVRYNVGGVGDFSNGEKRSHKSRGWHALIEGYQVNEGSDFDWDRDQEQRNFLQFAAERGIDRVEIFSNAPMWWMMDSLSSFGGSLVRHDDFVTYLAEVTAQARSAWQLPVVSLAPFNEPSAGWWKYPHNQEGCNIPSKTQSHLVLKLRGELDRRGLQDVIIAASDENTPDAAAKTWEELRNSGAASIVGRINVHGYDGLKPWREAKHQGSRARLCRMAEVAQIPIWMDEYGDGGTDGMDLAQSILEDVHYLKPAAWCYWQVVEHKCSWGLIETEFNPAGVRNTGRPHAKYFVLAHFTRLLRPGSEMLHCTQPWALAGLSPCKSSSAVDPATALTIVLMNRSDSEAVRTLTVPGLSALTGQGLEAHVTQPKEEMFFVKTDASVAHNDDGALEVRVRLPASSVCSVVVPGVVRSAASLNDVPKKLRVSQVIEMARRTSEATVAERRLGEGDPRTREAWARCEHCRAASSGALGGQEIFALVLSSAWGAANERAFGRDNLDARRDWESFHSLREKYHFGDDLDWAIFNMAWATADAAWWGSMCGGAQAASKKVAEHVARIGAETEVVPGGTF